MSKSHSAGPTARSYRSPASYNLHVMRRHSTFTPERRRSLPLFTLACRGVHVCSSRCLHSTSTGSPREVRFTLQRLQCMLHQRLSWGSTCLELLSLSQHRLVVSHVSPAPPVSHVASAPTVVRLSWSTSLQHQHFAQLQRLSSCTYPLRHAWLRFISFCFSCFFFACVSFHFSCFLLALNF